MENQRRNRLLTVLFFGVLMGALDIAIVGPALPAIRSQFQVSERALTWIFSMYVLFQLVSTPLMAKLSDLYGRRWIYILDLALFAAGSTLVAFSGNFFMIVAGRAIQGFGAGGIFPVASAVIGDTFPLEKRGSALGLIGAVFGLAFLIGPILGGVVLSLATWHWLFLINLPVAGVIILFSIRLLPVTRPGHSPRFDWAGMAVLSLLLGSLAFGINQLDTTHFFSSLFSPAVGPFLGLSLGLLVLLRFVEHRAENPILPERLFNRRQLGLAYLLSAGAGFAEASLVFMPLLAVISLQGAGITQKNASWMLMPVVLAMMIGSPLAGRLLDHVGSKPVIFVGNLVMTIGLVLLSLFSTSLPLFILSGVLVGLGLSALLGAPVRYIMLNEARVQERSVAQGVITLFSSVGQLIGSALVGAVAASRAVQSPLAGYSTAFLTVAGVGVLLLLAAWFLKNRDAELETIREHAVAGEAEQL
ncbi:arabinose efflux permease [Anaerolinea thermolimosa]|uniref:MFS transporter n=1 Tax=Anaerolinea thermolimosa TaxID=229919 RepID=UPI0007809085|nr:MFS transporter [Anaerolinea thermolimosa]GAP05523.1 arabinose efflux permease [Anaerolinea thermolimosa]